MKSGREPAPAFLPPMLCASRPAPTGTGWAFEIKWDGLRGQLRLERGDACLRTRPGRVCSREFPELVEGAAAIDADSLLLDGELVVLDADGKPDFAAVRRRLVGDQRGQPAVFVAFDVLHHDGVPVRELRYTERRQLLNTLDLGATIRVPRWFRPDESEHVLRWTRDQHLEGVVAKRLNSRYNPGRRSPAWVKIKHRRVEPFVITGWQPGVPGRLDEYWLARRTPGGLSPAGTATLGLSGEVRTDLNKLLATLERTGGRRGRVRRVVPQVEALVSLHGRQDGPLRDPVIREIRTDGSGAPA